MTFPFPFLAVGELREWQTLYDQSTAFDWSSDGWGGYTVRQEIPAAQLLSSGTGRIRVEFKGPTYAESVVGKAYVGSGAATGDSYDFASTPVQLFAAGNAGVTIAANAIAIFETVAPVVVDPAQRLIISIFFSGTSTLRARQSSLAGGWRGNYKSGDDAATVNASGYSVGAAYLYTVGKAEILI